MKIFIFNNKSLYDRRIYEEYGFKIVRETPSKYWTIKMNEENNLHKTLGDIEGNDYRVYDSGGFLYELCFNI